ncbi:MAG TPA: hypothetical protein VIR57_18725 [Chloroflexota bacterium]
MAVVLMMLLLGGVVLAACALMPREIGKEDELLSNIRLELPDLQHLALRMTAPRRSSSRPAPRPAAPPPQPDPAEDPSAMGAPQPVLTQDPAGTFALPGQ